MQVAGTCHRMRHAQHRSILMAALDRRFGTLEIASIGTITLWPGIAGLRKVDQTIEAFSLFLQLDQQHCCPLAHREPSSGGYLLLDGWRCWTLNAAIGMCRCVHDKLHALTR